MAALVPTRSTRTTTISDFDQLTLSLARCSVEELAQSEKIKRAARGIVDKKEASDGVTINREVMIIGSTDSLPTRIYPLQKNIEKDPSLLARIDLTIATILLTGPLNTLVNLIAADADFLAHLSKFGITLEDLKTIAPIKLSYLYENKEQFLSLLEAGILFPALRDMNSKHFFLLIRFKDIFEVLRMGVTLDNIVESNIDGLTSIVFFIDWRKEDLRQLIEAGFTLPELCVNPEFVHDGAAMAKLVNKGFPKDVLLTKDGPWRMCMAPIILTFMECGLTYDLLFSTLTDKQRETLEECYYYHGLLPRYSAAGIPLQQLVVHCTDSAFLEEYCDAIIAKYREGIPLPTIIDSLK